MRWNLEWLRTFKAIYETGTLSAAAQELFMSQPGVSLHLNALEAFTGTRLFERSARRMLPTEKGKMLYNFVLDPLTKLESGEQHFHKRAQNERVTVSIGMCFETFQYTFEKHIASLPFNLIVRFGDYAQMQHDLETGLLDFIVTPHADPQPKLEYVPFSKERIVLIAGNGTDTEELQSLLGEGDWKRAERYLQKQVWYSTAADMEHMKNFWMKQFGHVPGFSPNYIVPNIASIIRCLGGNTGYSIVPDFLCQEALAAGDIRLVWEGKVSFENTLYFGTRKKTVLQREIDILKSLLLEKWCAPETE